ncbi:MAG: CopD family protein [Sphingomonadaceae bacterium]|nr:CopD family protein [Sphingomonadaceae bacterium]
MIGFLGNAYLWVVAAHVIFVIFLMASLFMMPRFFIYHQEAEVGSAEAARWVDRESKLRRIIMNPSICMVWILGLMLAANGDFWLQGWFLAKLALVTLLSAYHGWLVGYAKALARGEQRMSGKKLRLFNEIPGLIVIPVVLLVFAKPF